MPHGRSGDGGIRHVGHPDGENAPDDGERDGQSWSCGSWREMLWVGQIGGTGIDVGGSGRFGILEHVCDGAVGGELADGVRVFGEGVECVEVQCR